MEYLGVWVTINGIQPVDKKLEAIVNMMPPLNKCQVRGYIGLVNYYRCMWDRQSYLLQPLTVLTSDKVMFKCTVV